MPGGRPQAITDNVLRILEDAFSVGASDREACFLAKISESTLYKYCEDHPEYSERKAMLKEMPKYKAKKVIVGEIEKGDKDTSKWYLERKGKDEGFNIKTEHEVKADINMDISKATDEELQQLLK